MDKINILIGHDGSKDIFIDAQKLVTGRTCIIAQSGAGKSYTIAVLCEQLLKHNIPFCIIDTEGEYFSLREKYNILWIGGSKSDLKIENTDLRKLAVKVISEGLPLILDISDVLDERKTVSEFLKYLYEVADELRKPYLLIVEETDKFAPQSREMLKEIDEISRRGRKRGLGILIASQRPALVNKCVTGDTPVLFSNGTLKPIKYIFDNSVNKTNGRNEQYGDIDIDILSLDSNLKIKKKKSHMIFRQKTPKFLYEIKTKTGRRLVVTDKHPFYYIDNNGIIRETPADKISQGIYLAVPQNIQTESNDKLEISKEILAANHYIISELKKKHTAFESAKFLVSSGVSARKAAHAISEDTGISEYTIRNWLYGFYKPLFYDNRQILDGHYLIPYSPHAYNINPIKIPETMTPDIGKFFGLLLSEGYEHRGETTFRIDFANSNSLMIDNFIETSKAFDIPVSISKENDGCFHAKTHGVGMMNALKAFGYTAGKLSGNKDIPDIVMNSSDRVVGNFLRGFFDGDAHIGKNMIMMNLKSYNIIYKLSYLLMRFGIYASVKKTFVKGYGDYWLLKIGGKSDIIKFKNFIGSDLPEKQIAIDFLCNKGSGGCTKNIVPNINNLLKKAIIDICGKPKYDDIWYDIVKNRRKSSKDRLIRMVDKLEKENKNKFTKSLNCKRLKLLSESDIFWDKVISAKKIKSNEKYLYDIVVPETENFIGGYLPIFIHNTVLSQCSSQMIGKLTTENDLQAVNLFFGSRKELEELPELEPGEFFIMGDISKKVKTKIKQRETKHKGLTPILIPKLHGKISLHGLLKKDEYVLESEEKKVTIRAVEPVINKGQAIETASRKRGKQFIFFGKKEGFRKIELQLHPLIYVELKRKEGIIQKKYALYSFILDGLTGDMVKVDSGLKYSKGFGSVLGLKDNELKVLLEIHKNREMTPEEVSKKTRTSLKNVKTVLTILQKKNFVDYSKSLKAYVSLVDLDMPNIKHHQALTAKEIELDAKPIKAKITESDILNIVKAIEKNTEILKFEVFYYPVYAVSFETKVVNVDGVTGKEV